MPGSSANYDVLDATGKTIAAQWPDLHEFLGAYVKLIAAMIATGTEPTDQLDGFILGNVDWRIHFSGGNLLIDENTGSVGSPVWTTRFTFVAGGTATGALPTHASTHQHGGSDEVATATPAANVIPKAGAGGTLADGFIAQSNVTQHEGAINHDALSGFVAAEHTNHTAVSITAGTGLSGGGDISATRTLNLANTAVTPGSYDHASITVDAQGRLTAASDGTPSRVYASKTTAQSGIGASETDVTDLTGLTITGADGAKKYRVNVVIGTASGGSTTSCIVRVYVGTNGALAGGATERVATVVEEHDASEDHHIAISGLEITPAASDKIGVSVDFDATANTVYENNNPANAGARSWIEVVEVG